MDFKKKRILEIQCISSFSPKTEMREYNTSELQKGKIRGSNSSDFRRVNSIPLLNSSVSCCQQH